MAAGSFLPVSRGATRVSFADVDATYTVDSDTPNHLHVPVGATSGFIAVDTRPWQPSAPTSSQSTTPTSHSLPPPSAGSSLSAPDDHSIGVWPNSTLAGGAPSA